MGQTTEIAYADSTANGVAGCLGCELYDDDPKKNTCYAAAMVRRYAGLKGWPQEFTSPEFFPGRLEKALRWPNLTGSKRDGKPWLDGYPRIIFLNDLGDTFAPNAPDPLNWLAPKLHEMEESPHIWLFLTKWPRRMRAFFDSVAGINTTTGIPHNFWLGTTITSDQTGNRLRELVKIRGASVLWLSLEPLLGPVDLAQVGNSTCSEWFENGGISWVVVGGASGPNAKPMHPDWARVVRNECQAAGVPYFFKQWGQFLPESQMIPGVHCSEGEQAGAPDNEFLKVGKSVAGDILDGRTWHEMPKLIASPDLLAA